MFTTDRAAAAAASAATEKSALYRPLAHTRSPTTASINLPRLLLELRDGPRVFVSVKRIVIYRRDVATDAPRENRRRPSLTPLRVSKDIIYAVAKEKYTTRKPTVLLSTAVAKRVKDKKIIITIKNFF